MYENFFFWVYFLGGLSGLKYPKASKEGESSYGGQVIDKAVYVKEQDQSTREALYICLVVYISTYGSKKGKTGTT
jgi:hypothetical protein